MSTDRRGRFHLTRLNYLLAGTKLRLRLPKRYEALDFFLFMVMVYYFYGKLWCMRC